MKIKCKYENIEYLKHVLRDLRIFANDKIRVKNETIYVFFKENQVIEAIKSFITNLDILMEDLT